MQEKYMVNDILNNLKYIIKTYTEGILESENIEFINTVKDLRNSLEKFEYDLLKISESKGYYSLAEYAELKEIKKIRSDLNIE